MTGVAGRHGRADALSDLFVPTQRVRQAFLRIDELLVRGWERHYCRALLMLGPSRSGKTVLVAEYLRERVDKQPDPAKRPVIASVEVPAGCSLKLFSTDLLAVLGDPAPAYGDQGEKTRRIAENVEANRVDLIVIDEVQRLIDVNTDRVKRDVANWLTALLNRRVCPLLLVGELSAERVFEDTLHLEGRTLGEVVIGPYRWADTAERDEFRGVLHLLDKQLGMTAPSGLGEVDTALRIHSYSRGLLGQAATLIDQARAVALRRRRPRIGHDIFAEAVDELRIGASRQKPNPFRLGDPSPGDGDMQPADFEKPRRTGSGRRRKVASPAVDEGGEG